MERGHRLWHESDPGLDMVERLLRGIVHARNFRRRQVRQRMSDKRRIHAVHAVEILFEGKDHQRLVDVLAQQLHSSLPPRPELRTHVVHDRDAALAHLARDAPVEGGGVDDDREFWLFVVDGADEFSKESIDFWEMAEDFGDADDGEVLGVDDNLATGSAHAVATRAKELKIGVGTGL